MASFGKMIDRLKARWCLLLLAGLCCSPAPAQHQLKGRVVDMETNVPMPFVPVFVNTTTIGTVTDEKGEFSLTLKPGKYELVVSYIGYEPVIYQADLEHPYPFFLFKLSPKEFALPEVEVKATRDKMWYVNLEVFREHFIGRSGIARKCKLLNPEVLIIDFNAEKGLLEVKAMDRLQIENPELGYRISYLLVEFKFFAQEGYVSLQGYPSYQLMKGGKAQENRWARNRKAAYNGSAMHFVRALRARQLPEEGFNLRRLHRMPNPERPSEEELQAARDELRRRGNFVNLASNDPVSVTLSKARLPKIIERLDTATVPYGHYLRQADQQITMTFEGFFQVVYTGEKEELAYVQASSGFQTRRPTWQTSVISLRGNPVLLEEMGNISDPLGVLFEGYWGWEKTGDMLPLDYGTEE